MFDRAKLLPPVDVAIAISWPYWKPETTVPGLQSADSAKVTQTFLSGIAPPD